MNVTVNSAEGIVTVTVIGEIDHHTASRIREKTDEAVNRIRPPLLVMDFSGVTFTDSSGIALVLGRYKLMNMLGGTFRITGMSPPVKKLFELAGINKFISMSGVPG